MDPEMDHSKALIVMVIHREVRAQTLQWLIEILKGLLLNISFVNDPKCLDNKAHDDDITLLISCSDHILKQNAKKIYRQLKRQTTTNTSDQLSVTEKQRIIHHLIQELHCDNRTIVPGLPDFHLYPGQSIVEVLCNRKIITDFYPLHDVHQLEQLRATDFGKEFDGVRNYFGEMIGFYFAFLSHYKDMLLYASFFYFSGYFLQMFSLEIYVLLFCFGIFVYLKLWRRYSNRLAHRWGTIDLYELDEPRPAFRSKEMYIDPITQKNTPYYPKFKTWIKEYLMSIPFVLFSLVLSYEVMIFYFKWEEWMAATNSGHDLTYISLVLSLMPGIAYALIVMIMNHLYINIVTKLNDYENHRTQESHENHLIVKLVLFESFNNFSSLYYIALYLRDIEMLKYNLIIMLTVNKLVENFLEVFVPWFMLKRSNPKIFKDHPKTEKEQIEHEKSLFTYEHTYYDIMELFTQYGYAFLFLAIWPWSPLVAYINSLVEIKIDSWRLCYLYRKPFQRSMKSINNAWIKSFEVLSIIIVITNLMILAMISERFEYLSVFFQISSFELVVYLEHIFFTILLIFWSVVPDIPKDVNLKLKRQRYLQYFSDEKTD